MLTQNIASVLPVVQNPTIGIFTEATSELSMLEMKVNLNN